MGQPTMPDLFGRLTDQVLKWAESDAKPFDWTAYELSSSRTLSGTDSQDRVTVVMDDFKVASIRVDQLWATEPHRTVEEIEERVVEAVNTVLRQYLLEEFHAASQASMPAPDLYEKLRELSADFGAAYERAMESIEARTPR